MGYTIVAKFADKRPNELAGECIGLQEAAAFAIRLADNIGIEAGIDNAEELPTSIAVYRDERLEIEISVFVGGLANGPASRGSPSK